MTEHSIRLRGGWKQKAADRHDAAEEPLTLPIRWSLQYTDRSVLTRPFQCPRLDLSRETLWLRLENVAGLIAARLNGTPIGAVRAELNDYEFKLQPLPHRNILVLEVETALCANDPRGQSPEWGFVSLVIRPILTNR